MLPGGVVVVLYQYQVTDPQSRGVTPGLYGLYVGLRPKDVPATFFSAWRYIKESVIKVSYRLQAAYGGLWRTANLKYLFFF